VLVIVSILPLDKLSVKFYREFMKLTSAAAQLGRKGGKARAAKYDAATLSEWAKKGGRPRQDAKGQGEESASPRRKGRRK
jgi:hypothetical protein